LVFDVLPFCSFFSFLPCSSLFPMLNQRTFCPHPSPFNDFVLVDAYVCRLSPNDPTFRATCFILHQIVTLFLPIPHSALVKQSVWRRVSASSIFCLSLGHRLSRPSCPAPSPYALNFVPPTLSVYPSFFFFFFCRHRREAAFPLSGYVSRPKRSFPAYSSPAFSQVS